MPETAQVIIRQDGPKRLKQAARFQRVSVQEPGPMVRTTRSTFLEIKLRLAIPIGYRYTFINLHQAR